MARSHYLYLVRVNACDTLLGVFTVKHEAITWAKRWSNQPLSHIHLTSMEDGIYGDKTEKIIPWPLGI